MPNNKKSTAIRSRTFELLLYPEWHSLKDILNKINNYDYAYILHDKDFDEQGQPKKPHIHVRLKFRNVRTLSSVQNEFCNDELTTNLIVPIHSWRGAIRYLIHLDDKDKYQYSKDEIKTNIIKDINCCFIDELETTEQTIQIIEYIDSYQGNLQTKELYLYCINHNLLTGLRSNNTWIKDMLKEHNLTFDRYQDVKNKIDREHFKQLIEQKEKFDIKLKNADKTNDSIAKVVDNFGYTTIEIDGKIYKITKLKNDEQIKLD